MKKRDAYHPDYLTMYPCLKERPDILKFLKQCDRKQELSLIHIYCKDCPYPRHGFLCWGVDGTCLRSRMNEINEKKEDNDHDERSSE